MAPHKLLFCDYNETFWECYFHNSPNKRLPSIRTFEVARSILHAYTIEATLVDVTTHKQSPSYVSLAATIVWCVKYNSGLINQTTRLETNARWLAARMN